jgi:hypothetical protein
MVAKPTANAPPPPAPASASAPPRARAGASTPIRACHHPGRLDGPFVVLFEQQGTDEAVDGLIVGEAADDHERPGGLSSDLRRRQGQQALEGLDQVIDRASRCLEHRLPRRCPEDRVRCDSSGHRLRLRPHFAQLGASRPQRWSTPGHLAKPGPFRRRMRPEALSAAPIRRRQRGRAWRRSGRRLGAWPRTWRSRPVRVGPRRQHRRCPRARSPGTTGRRRC